MIDNHIGLLGESSLHASLKSWYANPSDRIEEPVNGYLIDLVRDDLLIEIQVRNFSSIKKKLTNLLEYHNIRVVHPIAELKWIKKIDHKSQQLIGRRKSPRRGRIEDLFAELVYISHLVNNPGFSFEVLLISKEEIRTNDGKGSWRRKGWNTIDHVLIDVISSFRFNHVGDYIQLLPKDIPEQFTTQDLSNLARMPIRTAQKMVYCLNRMGGLDLIGKKGHSFLYQKRADVGNE